MLPCKRILECVYIFSHIFNLISQDKWRETWVERTETATPDLSDVSFLICIVFVGALAISLHPSSRLSFPQSVNMPHVCICAHGVHFIKSSSFWSWFWSSSCFWSLSPVDKRVLAELSSYRLQRKWEKLNYFCLFRFRFLQDIALCNRTFFEYF